jgi:ABC-2 type transport system permease protein
MIKGLGFGFVIKQAAILGAMTLVFLFIAIRKFKIRLE